MKVKYIIINKNIYNSLVYFQILFVENELIKLIAMYKIALFFFNKYNNKIINLLHSTTF